MGSTDVIIASATGLPKPELLAGGFKAPDKEGFSSGSETFLLN
jgi:hypothetical protein